MINGETKMKKNVGSPDQIVRYIVGAAIIGAGIYFKTWWGLVGIVPIVTALMGVCPAYNLIGINTCKTQKK
jgi:hypothetical protein